MGRAEFDRPMVKHRPSALAEALATVDGLARGVLAQLAPIRLELADSDEHREAAYRLRHVVAVREGWIRGEDLPRGAERDGYDDDALHVVGWDGDLLAATARLVFPHPERPLPMEEIFETEIEPRGQVVELGRISVDPAYRERHHLLLYGLLSRSWLEMRARGFHVLAGLASASMLERYRQMGFQMTVLAPPRTHWAEERYPIRFDVAPNRDGLEQQYEGSFREAPRVSVERVQ